MLKKMVRRAVVSFTLGPLGLYLIYKGGLFYFLPVAFILLVAAVEYTRMVAKLEWHVPVWLFVPAVALQLIAGQWPDLSLAEPALALTLFVAMGYALWRYERGQGERISADWLVTIAGVIFIGWLGSYFFRLRVLDTAMDFPAGDWTILAMLSIWTADSGAYLFGSLMGRHKLSPRLSPNKTIEGYVGGIILALIITQIAALFLTVPVGQVFIVAGSVAILAPAGDLGISLLKRETEVKDSGSLFWSHGGALDRIDSLIWAVTLVYYLLLFMA